MSERTEGNELTSSPALPVISRPGVGTILVSLWIVGSLERQRAAVDAMMAEYHRLGPPAGLLSLSCFASPEGSTVLNYAQWTSDEAHREFQRADRPVLAQGVDEVVPGIERPGVTRYRLYRSFHPGGAPGQPGCIAVVTIHFDRPGRARRWVDEVVSELATVDPVPGLVANHFHVSTDETRALNYAEWTDEQAHRDAVDGDRGPIGRHGPVGRLFRTRPGVKHLGFERYQLYRNLTRP